MNTYLMLETAAKCWNCHTKEATIKVLPVRHLVSPTWMSGQKPWHEHFCSKECQKEFQEASYAFWASIDRNASDSECFEHVGWDKKMRLGRCKITGEEVRVQPLMFGENSGQPKACYEHFQLKEKYADILKRYA